MADQASLQATIHGHVQGVFFRAFVREKATALGLTGYARNLPSGQDVEVKAEGDRDQLEELVKLIKVGPPGARVDNVNVNWSRYRGHYSQFEILY
jgi:acylphosphatase